MPEARLDRPSLRGHGPASGGKATRIVSLPRAPKSKESATSWRLLNCFASSSEVGSAETGGQFGELWGPHPRQILPNSSRGGISENNSNPRKLEQPQGHPRLQIGQQAISAPRSQHLPGINHSILLLPKIDDLGYALKAFQPRPSPKLNRPGSVSSSISAVSGDN